MVVVELRPEFNADRSAQTVATQNILPAFRVELICSLLFMTRMGYFYPVHGINDLSRIRLCLY